MGAHPRCWASASSSLRCQSWVWRSSGCRAETSCSALLWESPEHAGKYSFLQDSPSAAGPWWDLGAVSASTSESCGCDLLQEAAKKRFRSVEQGPEICSWHPGTCLRGVQGQRGCDCPQHKPQARWHHTPRLGAAPKARNAPSQKDAAGGWFLWQ